MKKYQRKQLKKQNKFFKAKNRMNDFFRENFGNLLNSAFPKSRLGDKFKSGHKFFFGSYQKKKKPDIIRSNPYRRVVTGSNRRPFMGSNAGVRLGSNPTGAKMVKRKRLVRKRKVYQKIIK